MLDGMLILGAFVAACVGFALFALSQQRHWQAVAGALGLSSRRQRQQYALAWLLLTLSLALTLQAEGAGFGSLLWTLLISAAAFAISFTLAWRPRWLACLTPEGVVAARILKAWNKVRR